MKTSKIFDDEPMEPVVFDESDFHDWFQKPIEKESLLSYMDARKIWRCTDADFAGWINAGKIDAYYEYKGKIVKFNWMNFPKGSGWKFIIKTLYYYDNNFDYKNATRYISYKRVLFMAKKYMTSIAKLGYSIDKEDMMLRGSYFSILKEERDRAEGFISFSCISSWCPKHNLVNTDGYPMWNFLAININGERLSKENIKNCIFLKDKTKNFFVEKMGND